MIDVDALALRVLALAAPHMSASDHVAFDLDRAGGDADAAVADAVRVLTRAGQPIPSDLRADLRDFVAECPDSSGARLCAAYLAKAGSAA